LPELAQDSRLYEMMIVVAPSVAEEGLLPVVERVSGYIATQRGNVASVKSDNPWGRRRLAYEIQDFRDAFYVLFTFDAGPGAIVEIDRDLKLDQHVIRHLIVRYDEMTEHVERPPRHAVDGPPRRSAPVETPAQPAQSAQPTEPEAAAEPEVAAVAEAPAEPAEPEAPAEIEPEPEPEPELE
jgi:small subunit ribosomal protein S6